MFRPVLACGLFVMLAGVFPNTCQAGPIYWNVFNIEDETAISAQIVTYATQADMLADTNRTGTFTPNPLGFATNIVGSGATIVPEPSVVPEPSTITLLAMAAVAHISFGRRRRRRRQ